MFRGGQSTTDGGLLETATATAVRDASSPSVLGNNVHGADVNASARVMFPSLVMDQPPGAVRAHSIATSASAEEPRRQWVGRYQWLLVAIDVVAASLAALVAFALRFNAPSVDGVRLDITFGLLLPLAWVLAVMGNGAYERRFVGVGNAEFERVFRAFLHLTVVTVFVFYAADAPVARGYAFPALGFALLFDLASRYAARKWLHRRRQHGRSMSSVVAIGGVASVAQFTALLRRDRYAGLEVVGACLPQGSARGGDGERELDAIGVPIVGDVDSIVDVVHSTGAHTVAVLSGEISAEKLRWISWQLEGTDTDLVVSPGLTEVAGRRLEIQPVAGLPLLHVKVPAFTGVRRM